MHVAEEDHVSKAIEINGPHVYIVTIEATIVYTQYAPVLKTVALQGPGSALGLEQRSAGSCQC